jgi:hypothetical protein
MRTNDILRDINLQAKSSLSTHATFKPRNLASRAAPAPVAPPPIIRTSNSSPDWSSVSTADLDGILNVSLPELHLRDKAAIDSLFCKTPSVDSRDREEIILLLGLRKRNWHQM